MKLRTVSTIAVCLAILGTAGRQSHPGLAGADQPTRPGTTPAAKTVAGADSTKPDSSVRAVSTDGRRDEPCVSRSGDRVARRGRPAALHAS